jgi:hypothetical protein
MEGVELQGAMPQGNPVEGVVPQRGPTQRVVPQGGPTQGEVPQGVTQPPEGGLDWGQVQVPRRPPPEGGLAPTLGDFPARDRSPLRAGVRPNPLEVPAVRADLFAANRAHAPREPSQAKPGAPPMFDPKSIRIRDWLFQLDMYFELTHAKAEQWSSLAFSYLPPHLGGIFRGLQEAEAAKGYGHGYVPWIAFCERMTQLFGGGDPSDKARDRLQKCSQRKSVDEYVTYFQTTLAEIDPKDMPNELDLINWFRAGLKEEIRREMGWNPTTFKRYESLSELISNAISLDNQLRMAKGGKGPRAR